MIRNFKLKMEGKRMESLYCLMNINTERKYIKSITFLYLVTFIPPFPKYQKSCMTSFPPVIRDPVWCVNFFYEYIVMLQGNTCITGGNTVLEKKIPFSVGYNVKFFHLSSFFSAI